MRRRPRRGEGAAVGLLLAAGVTCGAAFVGAVDASAVAECAPIMVDQSGDWDASGNAGEVAALRAMGWSGDPSDGLEALYPPGCLTQP